MLMGVLVAAKSNQMENAGKISENCFVTDFDFSNYFFKDNIILVCAILSNPMASAIEKTVRVD